MANIENLTNKILSDAREKEKEIIESAEKKRSEILFKSKIEADNAEGTIISKANAEGNLKKERIISNAILKVRNDNLGAKQKVIEETFEKALDKLINLNEEDIKDFIRKSVLSLEPEGDEVLILNEDTKAYIGKEFINEINKLLIQRGKMGEISISPESGRFRGGFILEKNGVEMNNTFETLISSKKDELEFEVAVLLFR